MKLWAFPKPLVEGLVLGRRKRFFADVRLTDGTEVVAHCANTGSMRSCWTAGDQVVLSHDPRPERKLAYTWEMTRTKGGYIGVNTARPNVIVEWALGRGLIPELAGYRSLSREVKYGREGSRIDLLLDFGERKAYVEVKNTTLLDGDVVRFPDSVTERGQKHVRELLRVARKGDRAVLIFFVNRPEGGKFAPADSVDPEYGKILRKAHKAGVELLAYRVKASLDGITLSGSVPIEL